MNPTATIAALALRCAEHLVEKRGATSRWPHELDPTARRWAASPTR